MNDFTDHLFIPDCQVKPGVNTDHLEALGNYIVDKQPEKIICIGDFADMHSLSTFDVGNLAAEGARYHADIECVNDAMERLLSPLRSYNEQQRKNKKKKYIPEMHMTLGNHEYRIDRHVERNPNLAGHISTNDLAYESWGWNVHPFLDILELDGVHYSHYFINPFSVMKTVVAGTIETKLKNLGMSFSMGHQQLLQYGCVYMPNGDRRQGLVAGSFYSHDEPYMGSQGNMAHWRGVIHKKEVKDGGYDPQFLSLDYMLRRWL